MAAYLFGTSPEADLAIISHRPCTKRNYPCFRPSTGFWTLWICLCLHDSARACTAELRCDRDMCGAKNRILCASRADQDEQRPYLAPGLYLVSVGRSHNA